MYLTQIKFILPIQLHLKTLLLCPLVASLEDVEKNTTNVPLINQNLMTIKLVQWQNPQKWMETQKHDLGSYDTEPNTLNLKT